MNLCRTPPSLKYVSGAPGDRSNVNASYSKAINIYFGKLSFCTNQHELSFVIIKFELIRKHPRTNVRYTAFHGNDRISLISSRVRTK